MQGQGVAAWRGALPADMEPAIAFMQRADRLWHETVVRHARAAAAGAADGNVAGGARAAGATAEQNNVLVVSHGGLIHVMLQNLVESRKLRLAEGVDVGRYRLPNASVTVVEVDEGGRGTVLMFADRTHLDVELVEENVYDVAKE